MMFDLTVLFIVGIIILFVVLAHFIELDITVKGPAEITSELGLRDAVALTDGFVARLQKKEGQQVQEGEVIAVIGSDTAPLEEVDKATKSIERLLNKVNIAKQSAVLSNDPLDLPTIRITDTLIVQDLANAQLALRSFQEQRRRITTQLESELRYTTDRIDVLTSKLRRMKSSGQKALLQPYIENTGEELGRLQGQVLIARNEAKVKLNDALSDLLRSLEIAKGALENYSRQHQVRAPIMGIIAKLDTEENSHIIANRSVATIVPTDSTFVAKIMVASKDIPQVRVGQQVLYKVEAYPYQRYGLFTGTVASIDQIKENRTSLPADTFAVKASISPPENLATEVKDKMKFVVGMRVESAVVTERKSISDLFKEKFFFKLTW
jgi:multidrug efflux pump subunit AcrA (membrane-fusion protein)